MTSGNCVKRFLRANILYCNILNKLIKLSETVVNSSLTKYLFCVKTNFWEPGVIAEDFKKFELKCILVANNREKLVVVFAHSVE